MQTDVSMVLHTKLEPTSVLPVQHSTQPQLCEPPTETAELSVEERMQMALNSVLHKGETPTCAARKWRLQRTTILYRLLGERKRLRDLETSTSHEPRKLFQSKFTSNQLLSAQQEEDLAKYLKQCYEMQYNGTHHNNNLSNSLQPPLLSEEVARSFTHNFVHMHNLKYPRSWDAKQQAATDWFNGFVDRNPEIIECVAPSTREKKQRKRTIKLEEHSNVGSTGGGGDAGSRIVKLQYDLLARDRHAHESTEDNYDNESNPENEHISLHAHCRIKDEPREEEAGCFEEMTKNKMQKLQINNEYTSKTVTDSEDNDTTDPIIPEVVYQTFAINKMPSNDLNDLPTASIAESVKRRTMRKPRILAEHLYAAEMTMEPETDIKQHSATFTIRKLAAATPQIKINNVDSVHQRQNQRLRNKAGHLYIGDQHVNEEPIQRRSLDDLKESIEKMHSDMNYLMQSMLMEMSENNRLLRRLISSQEGK